MSAATKKPKIQSKIRKADDLEIRVTTQFAGGTEFVEIRDYVRSTKTYGRGATFQRHLLPQIIEALQDLEAKSPSQIPGQQALDLGDV